MFTSNILCDECGELFNDSNKAPRIYSKCGHNICQSCLFDHFRTSLLIGLPTIKCKICSETHPIQLLKWNQINGFPKNFLGIEIIRNAHRKRKCPHPDEKKNLLCFETNCIQKEAFCVLCYNDIHFLCNKGYIMKIKEFQNKMEFEKPEINMTKYRNCVEILRSAEFNKNTGFVRDLLNEIDEKCEILFKRIQNMNLEGYGNMPHFWKPGEIKPETKIKMIFQGDHLDQIFDKFEKLLNEMRNVSELQLLFNIFVIIAELNLHLDNKSFDNYKCLQNDSDKLTEYEDMYNCFMDSKNNDEFELFKNCFKFFVDQFELFDLKEDHKKSLEVLYEIISKKNDQILKSTAKMLEIESQIKPILKTVSSEIPSTFEFGKNYLMLRVRDSLKHESKLPGDHLMSSGEFVYLKNLVVKNLPKCTFYLCQKEFDQLQEALKEVSPEDSKVILESLIDAESENLYCQGSKKEKSDDICLLFCKKLGTPLLESYFVKKIKSQEIEKLKNIIFKYKIPLRYKIFKNLTKFAKIGLSLEEECWFEKTRKAHSKDVKTRRILNKMRCAVLTKESRKNMLEMIDKLYTENQSLFDSYSDTHTLILSEEEEVDNIQGAIAAEKLALSFFEFMKEN